MKISFSILLIIIISLAATTVWSQDKPLSQIIKTTIPDNPTVSIKNDDYNPEVSEFNKDDEYKTAEGIAGQGENFSLTKINKDVFDINAYQTLIENGNEQYLGHCVVTERTGSTAGTIWVVAGIRSSSAGEDRIGIFKTGPSGWILQTIILTQRYLGYSIDAELVETSGGGKYLWTVVDSRQSPFSRREVYYAGLNIENPFERITGILNWPGAGSSDEYYNARITTDNYDFPDNPWIYVVASLDSLTFDNKHVNAQKFAFITSPYNLTDMQIHYRMNILPVYWPNGGTTETHYLYSDIAYYRLFSTPGNARLIFTYSNIPEDTKIWLSTCKYDGTDAQFLGTIIGHGDYKISNSAISSPGGGLSQQLMVVFEENYQNSDDWDLVSARSNDLGGTWTLNYIDGYSSNTDKLPVLGSVVGRKGVEDEYYVSYASYKPGVFIDSIMSAKSNNGTTNYWDQKVRMDGIYPTTNIFSSVGITNTPDERVTVWSSLIGSSNFNLIGSFWPNLPSAVEDETVTNPNSYQLFQNFPNPFNPTTVISYQLPVSGDVTLKVYDLLGNDVATLVDEYRPAGNYKIEWDAAGLSSGIYFYKLQTGSLIETKKMILIK